MKKTLGIMLLAICLLCCSCSASVLPQMPAADARDLLMKAVETLPITGNNDGEDIIKNEVLYSMIETGLERALEVAELDISEAQVSCRITYRTDELISFVLTVTSEEGGAHLCPLTFSMKDGRECGIDTFFKDDDAWRGVLPELATRAAQKNDIALLCAIPAIDNDQKFYLDDGGIVLVYRPYEIATYNGGYPCLRIAAKDVETYLSGAYGVQ